ncbi:MAG: AraC family transcriptional regulator [Maribacter sp.]|uniref:AraC family transcriptional regulator n=1 Tax=Maribacter sp. TaxID=1897614 RepID=UPI003C76E98B
MKAQYEKITGSGESSFNAFVYENENFDAPWHFHAEYELTYIEKGKGIRYVGNSVEKFEEGDLVLLGSNLPHCWKNSPQNTTQVKSLVFQWDDHLLGSDWLLRNEFKTIRAVLNKASEGIKFNEKYAQGISEKLKEIMDFPPFTKLIGFLQLLEELSTTHEMETLTTSGFLPNLNRITNKRIDKVYDFVQNNYDKKIKLTDVSSLVSMGDEAFCRFFKKAFNKSFFTFINEYRINLACKMLIETNMQISQIAYSCGYESLPFFYRQFKKFMGCSPLVYQKKYVRAFSK